MQAQGSKQGVAVHLAPLAYCTDNAAMVGAAAFQRLHWVACGLQFSGWGVCMALETVRLCINRIPLSQMQHIG